MIVITILAFLTALWIIAIIFWLVMVKKRLLDPRIYVLYGLFHWLIVGQLGTLLGYNFYEVKPFFDEAVHAKAAILIMVSVLSFLIGYSIMPITKSSNVNSIMLSRNGQEYGIKAWRLALVGLALGTIGLGSSLYFQSNVSLIHVYNFLPLLITYIGIAGSIVAIHVLIMERHQIHGIIGVAVKLILVVIALGGIFLSNVMLIFPLFYAVFCWYHNWLSLRRHGYLKRVIAYSFLIPFVALWSIIFKVIIQRNLGPGELDISIGMQEVVHRWRSLDLFNPESYGIVLHSMGIYADTGQLLAGRSFLVALPFLRLLSENIRGFGRIIVLDIYGPSYLTMNVGWGVPPIGELVANFGYISPILFYALLGIACRYLYLKYRRCGRPVYRAFYGVLLPWLFIQQRGDFLNGWVFPGYVVLLVIVVFWIAEKRRKHTNENHSYH